VGIDSFVSNNPPSVPKATLIVLFFPVSDETKLTTSELIFVFSPGYSFVIFI